MAAADGRDLYRATTAERDARRRRCRPKERKLVAYPALAARVSEGLEQRWSPGQIATRLAREFPDDAEARVSHETMSELIQSVAERVHAHLEAGTVMLSPFASLSAMRFTSGRHR